ncbi:hypothetical protein CBR_g19373 [Chara braunii]|uniref:Peptidase A2 domain-containing protein n=1 Tax=Chara braunii TaxID=69332 RepID=A0A388KXR2_CHABU|nr:hypothetical protein CBR_g19373 [Chara braunii]|eukprot:GBG74860.1 hypothetical protein CBR_g19373 [Chara braunii]
MDGAARRHDNIDDGRNDIRELARVIRHSQREPYPKIGVPLFDGNHASSWADKFEQLGYSNEWTDEKMFRMIKKYCKVEYREEIDELVRISRDWPDFKARLLEKYQLSDRLLDLQDLRAVNRKKFGTTKQFLSKFERVADLIPDLSDKDRCLIFLDNFNDVEQSKLVEGMQGRYDWTKIQMRRRSKQLQRERGSEKAVEEEFIPVSENEEDNEDERLRAEEEERARPRALEREPEKGKAEVSEEKPRKKKKHLFDPRDAGDRIEQLVDKIMESQRDLVTLKEILAVSPKIREEFKQRMTRKIIMTVKLDEVIPPEANWSPPGTKMDWRTVSTDHSKVQIGQQEYSTLVDDGAEMNIIRECHAIEVGLKINQDDYGVLVGASESTSFCGTASDVLVTVGKVRVRSYFYVLPRVEHEVLLGWAFLCRSKSIIINNHDGTMFVILCDPVCGYYEVVTCANTGPYCSRNRLNPESYSFPESEKLKREKESLGEESNPREFSLTLPDTGQTIDFVSTHVAIDPNVVQALMEIITDTGSA